MKTKLLVFIVIAVVSVTTASETSDRLSFTITPRILSQSMDEDGVPLYGGVVSETTLDIVHSSGWYLQSHYTRGLSGRRSALDYQSQLKTFIGWEGEVTGGTLDVGYGYYDYAPMFQDKDTNIQSFYAEFKFDAERGLRPFAGVEVFYQPRSTAYYEGGTRVTAGFRHTALFDRATLEHSITGVYEDGAFGYGKAIVGIYRADVTWRGRGRLELIAPSLALYQPFEKSDGQEREVVVGVGVRWTL